MITTGIKELKNRLSHYLASVKKGEDILITDRGKVIARVIPANHESGSWKRAIQPLVLKGIISLPTREIERDVPDPIEVSGKPVSEMVIEDRR